MSVGNLQGSWWFLPLVEPLGSAKPIRKDRWTEIPMPDSALTALNASALNSGGGKVDFSLTLDGRKIELEQVELDDRHEKHERADGPVRVTPDAEQTPDAVELFSDVPIPGIDEPTPEGRLGEGGFTYDEVVCSAAPSGLETVSLHTSDPPPAANIIQDMEIDSNLGVERMLSVVPSAYESGMPPPHQSQQRQSQGCLPSR